MELVEYVVLYSVNDNREIPPWKGGEGRQARGDVPVGQRRLGCCRDIPQGTEAVPTPFQGGFLPRNATTAVQD
jgi:hypothetical protein